MTAKFASCDSWQGAGSCTFYGYLSPDADPFEEGFPIFSGQPLEAFFKRKPMSFPE